MMKIILSQAQFTTGKVQRLSREGVHNKYCGSAGHPIKMFVVEVVSNRQGDDIVRSIWKHIAGKKLPDKV